MFFFWFDATVWRAKKKTVTLDDLWDLNKEDSVTYLYPHWEKIWGRKLRRGSGEKNNGKEKPPPKITMALAEAFGPTLFWGNLFQLVYVLLQFVSPQILNLLIAYVQSKIN